jgi:hypothetical protein
VNQLALQEFEDTRPQPQFRLNRRHGLERRIAAYLDWCAEQAPGKMVPYSRIASVVLCLSSKLGDDSDLVRAVRDKLYQTRNLLIEVFGRDLITDGVSARATTSGKDTFDARYKRELLKTKRQTERIGRTLRLVEKQGIDDHPEIARHISESKAVYDRIGGTFDAIVGSLAAFTPEAGGDKPTLH